MSISAIYKIESKIKPARCYIGSSMNINKRWKNHLNELRSNKHGNIKLQNHFNKYGESDLYFSILLGCDNDDLIKIEQYFIDSYKPYFNILKLAGATSGKNKSMDTKTKMSISHKGLNTWIKGRKMTDKHKEQISKGLKGRIPWNKGKKMSEMTCKKMAISAKGNTNKKGKKLSESQIENLRKRNTGNKYNLGRKASVETKRKFSKMRIGKGNGFFGKRHTEEAKQKMRNSKLRNKLIV